MEYEIIRNKIWPFINKKKSTFSLIGKRILLFAAVSFKVKFT